MHCLIKSDVFSRLAGLPVFHVLFLLRCFRFFNFLFCYYSNMNPTTVSTCGSTVSVLLLSIIYLFKSHISTGLKVRTSLSEAAEFSFMNRSRIVELRAKLQQLAVQSPDSDLCRNKPEGQFGKCSSCVCVTQVHRMNI